MVSGTEISARRNDRDLCAGTMLTRYPLPPVEKARKVPVQPLRRGIPQISLMKQLYRPRTERIFGGVCSGIGYYFDTDPNMIRIIWVVLTLISIGVGVIAYFIAWVLIPEEEDDRAEVISVT